MSRYALGAILLAGLLAPPPAAAELVDPTLPPRPLAELQGVSPDVAARPRVTSILVSPARRVAVVDGRSVRIGDRIAGGEVVAIDLTGVRLRGAEGELELPLLRTPPGKQPKNEE